MNFCLARNDYIGSDVVIDNRDLTSLWICVQIGCFYLGPKDEGLKLLYYKMRD